MNEMMNYYIWRQRREDMMREVQRDRLNKALRADRNKRTFSLAWELRRMAGLLLKFFRRLVTRSGARP